MGSLLKSRRNKCFSFVKINCLTGPQFCTCHDSRAVMACANLWPDWSMRIKIGVKRTLNFELINCLCVKWVPGCPVATTMLAPYHSIRVIVSPSRLNAHKFVTHLNTWACFSGKKQQFSRYRDSLYKDKNSHETVLSLCNGNSYTGKTASLSEWPLGIFG